VTKPKPTLKKAAARKKAVVKKSAAKKNVPSSQAGPAGQAMVESSIGF
jgi:hypothetical protein